MGTDQKLGDFTTSPRVIAISLLAVVIGLLSAFVAAALLWLIRRLAPIQMQRTPVYRPA